MNVLEYQSNAWGQPVLQGVSWNLIWISVALGLVVIVSHALFLLRRKRVLATNSTDSSTPKHIDE